MQNIALFPNSWLLVLTYLPIITKISKMPKYYSRGEATVEISLDVLKITWEQNHVSRVSPK